MADAQCVIRSSSLSAWQSTYRHYVRFELVHACRPLDNPVRENVRTGARLRVAISLAHPQRKEERRKATRDEQTKVEACADAHPRNCVDSRGDTAIVVVETSSRISTHGDGIQLVV